MDGGLPAMESGLPATNAQVHLAATEDK